MKLTFEFELPDGTRLDVSRILVDVLVYHQRADVSSCACGWSVLGASHAEHVADVFTDSIAIRGDR